MYIAQIAQKRHAQRAVQSLGRNRQRKGALGRPRYKWDRRTLILYFEEMRWEGVDWVHSVQVADNGLGRGGGALSKAVHFGCVK